MHIAELGGSGAIVELGKEDVIMDWKKELYTLLDQEEYACFLETLAERINEHAGEIDAELMYEGAFAYFMLGDYDRAINWVNNTLQVDGGNLKARILLGRICILEERTEDALAVFEFVLEHDDGSLSEDDREDIATIASYYARKDEEHTKSAYPYLSVLLGFASADTLAARQSSQNFCMGVEDKPAEGGKAEAEAVAVAEDQLSNILAQKIALRDKVKLLETTAGGFYMEGLLDAAERLLAAALALDPLDENILRSMAIVQVEMGQREKALRFAAQMQRMDFLLLRHLKG